MSTSLNRRGFLGSMAAGPFIRTSAAGERRPNFIFLLTDDQSYATTSLTGSPFMKTPNIDRIGREGALFTNAFVAFSLCAPSRACFLTGLYPHKNGIINNNIRWNQDLQTLPLLLHDAGYRTAHMGKWHMDGDDRVQPGYDYWAAQIGQGQYVDPRKNVNGEWKDLKGYDTEILTNQALEFMRASKGRPFCVWMGYKACHGPFTPAPGHEKDFSDVEFKPPASLFIDDEGKPERVRNKSQYRGMKQPPDRKKKKKAQAGDPPRSMEAWAARERDQYRCLMGVEDSVGRLFQFLDEQKLADDTIIVYSGDNGFFHGEHGLHGKSEAYEESIRVPMMVRYPRAIRGGQRIGSFVSNVDMAPSVLDLCGVKAARPMQGHSWRGLVTGRGGASPWRDSFVYTLTGPTPERPTVKALRTDRYKLIYTLAPAPFVELYDLQADPQEMKNLAQQGGNKDLIGKLKNQLLAEMKKIEDPALPLVEKA